MQPLVVSGDL